MTSITVAGRHIGTDHPVFVIAEISANHGGSLERTLEIVRTAAECGADAVKLQTYTADSLTIDSDAPRFVVGPGNPWTGRRLYELYQQAAMPWEWYPRIAETAAEVGIVLFSTPFDRAAVEFLVEQGSPALKIASFELTDLPLIAVAASTGLPLIMSTGMATSEEIDDAVRTAREHGDGGVALLRCNSAYPAPVDQMDLLTVADMAQRWPVPVGLSDHTLDHTSAVVAVALGARIIEKHITMARSDGGPDSSFSLEPEELRTLVATIRSTESAVGSVRYGPSDADRPSLAFRRSLYVLAPIATGELLTESNLGSRRPMGELEPRHLPDLLGRRAARDLEIGHAITLDDVS